MRAANFGLPLRSPRRAHGRSRSSTWSKSFTQHQTAQTSTPVRDPTAPFRNSQGPASPSRHRTGRPWPWRLAKGGAACGSCLYHSPVGARSHLPHVHLHSSRTLVLCRTAIDPDTHTVQSLGWALLQRPSSVGSPVTRPKLSVYLPPSQTGAFPHPAARVSASPLTSPGPP